MNTAIKTVYEMIERNFGKTVCDWLDLHIDDNSKKQTDWFEIKSLNGKVSVTANNGVSLARGAYEYLKRFCHVQLTQTTCNTKLPAEIVLPTETIYKETSMKLRYAYNYCTHSYTMAFWGETEWQKELDVLAFHGVNLILDITGQEMVWFKFFQKLGYDKENARKMLVGPAYWAWFCMANMYAYDGELPDEYLERRVELAKKNHKFMKSLGISPVLMGYSGFVPDDIAKYDNNAKIIPQGEWNHFPRPAMLKTNKPCYHKYAELFYEAQREVFGNITDYYSVDTFHEGGKKGRLSDKTVAKNVLKAMKKENENCVWVIQSWGSNPTNGQLKAVKKHKENVLILDLYAEVDPRFKYFRKKEFGNTPWIYCMLNNFGGRLGLHGHLDNMQTDIPYAMENCKYIKGVGITPEASNTNALLTEYLFDVIWDANDADWLNDYLYSRYGIKSKNAEKCFEILCNTVFKADNNKIGQGAPESVINARPEFNIDRASFWGNSKIGYDNNELVNALDYLLKDYEMLKDKETYIQDIVDIKKQILSNKALAMQDDIAKAYNEKDIDRFAELSDNFLKLILEVDDTLSSVPYYTLDNWLNMAKNASAGLGKETEKLFINNAKKLITTWGDRIHANDGCLRDYSNRQWSGLTKTLYYNRWSLWFENRKKELRGGAPITEDFYEIERQWAEN